MNIKAAERTVRSTISRLADARALPRLFFNHMDAWAMAFGITTVALYVHNAITPKTIVLLVGVPLAYWLAFAVNDFFDAPYDAYDPSKAQSNFFVDRPYAQVWASAIFGIGLTFLIGLFAQFGWRGLCILALGVVVMWAYSALPLRLKSRPGLDLLTHAIFVETFPYIVCLILIEATWTRLDLAGISLAVIASLTAQLEQQARDFDVDSQTDMNFTTKVGLDTSMRLLKGMTIVGLILFIGYVVSGIIPLYIATAIIIVFPIIFHRLCTNNTQPRPPHIVFASTILGLIYTGGILAYQIILSMR